MGALYIMGALVAAGFVAQAVAALFGDGEVGTYDYHFADGVGAANGAAASSTVYNSDNAFLIGDGTIRNISGEELYLFMQLSAKVVCNDAYAYDATIMCERNGGSELDTMLLPMASARMVVFAEVPADLMNDDAAEWKICFEANGETLEYELQ